MNTYKQKRGALLQEHLFIRKNWQNSRHMTFRGCELCAAALVSRLDCQHCKTSVTCAQHPAGITDELTTGSPLRFPGLPPPQHPLQTVPPCSRHPCWVGGGQEQNPEKDLRHPNTLPLHWATVYAGLVCIS